MAEEGVHRFNLAVPTSLWERFVQATEKAGNRKGSELKNMTDCALQAIREWTARQGV